MTTRVYYSSDELTLSTQVLDCTATDDGRYQVVLAQTLFHPQGGGQLADRGLIAGVAVEAVSNDGDTVRHIVGQPIAPGPVDIRVCGETRQLHARLHSAGHLISGVGQLLGWRPSKGHHWPGECRVVFERQDGVQELTAERLEQAVNQLIEADAPRRLVDQDGVRSVCFGELPMHGCGGTHVASAGQVGRLSILKIKEKKAQLSVHYDVARTPE